MINGLPRREAVLREVDHSGNPGRASRRDRGVETEIGTSPDFTVYGQESLADESVDETGVAGGDSDGAEPRLESTARGDAARSIHDDFGVGEEDARVAAKGKAAVVVLPVFVELDRREVERNGEILRNPEIQVELTSPRRTARIVADHAVIESP